jgi:hypothetical protein
VNADIDILGPEKGRGWFFPSEVRDTRQDVALEDGIVVKKIVILCTGTAFVDAMVPFWGNYSITASASAKTKFSTAK